MDVEIIDVSIMERNRPRQRLGGIVDQHSNPICRGIVID